MVTNNTKMGFVKRIKLNEDGQPNDVAGKFLGFLPIWMAPPANLDAHPSDYQMMGLAIFEPLTDRGSPENQKRTREDVDKGCIRYELLMSSSVAGQMQGVQPGEVVEVEWTGLKQRSRRGFQVELYTVKRDIAALQREPLFTFLPTASNWTMLSAELQEAAMRRRSLGMGALHDEVLERVPSLPQGDKEVRAAIWGDNASQSARDNDITPTEPTPAKSPGGGNRRK